MNCESCGDFGIVMYVASERCAQGDWCPDCDAKPSDEVVLDAIKTRKIRVIDRRAAREDQT